jgi:hypothetical protein
VRRFFQAYITSLGFFGVGRDGFGVATGAAEGPENPNKQPHLGQTIATEPLLIRLR